jgi:hypothetical protein
MPITYKLDPPTPNVVLTPTDPLTIKSVADVADALAKDPALQGKDLVIEWRPPPPAARPEDPDWKYWARHYDTLAWQVTSIFTAGSVILTGGYVNARVNYADAWIQSVLAGAGVGLILFQMFIVGTFRTYRYELYEAEKTRDPHSPALDIFRKWTGTPWVVYCVVAWVATLPWLFALWRLTPPPVFWVVGGLATAAQIVIGWWASPPRF